MLRKKNRQITKQVEIISLDALVPENHLLRAVNECIDFDFIYDEVKDKYSEDTGRPSIDPVVLIKLIMLQALYGIRSMRQTINEAEVNVAYRWFLGYGLQEKIPHFSTYGKNYERRFKESDLFDKIFVKIGVEVAFNHRSFIGGDLLRLQAAEGGDKKKIRDLRESELLKKGQVLSAEMFCDQDEADIEDVMGRLLYITLVNMCYSLKGKHRIPDKKPANSSLVLKEVENFFATLPPEIPEFDHYSPALFLTENTSLLLKELPELDIALNNFEKLFIELNSMLD